MNVENQKYPWRLFLVLWAMAVFGLICVIPYTMTLQAEQLQTTELPMALEWLLLLQISANALFFGLLTGLGVWLADRIGKGAPFLEAVIYRKPLPEKLKSVLLISVITGLLTGFLIIVLDSRIFNLEQLGLDLPALPDPPAWQGFLASFYGGITEEILFRLFFLSLLIWLFRLLLKEKYKRYQIPVFWTANILIAVLFGLGHLPATVASGLPLNAFIITRAIVLNGIGGIVFGWLYWRNGLEGAMAAHFSADIVVHVIF